MSTSSSASALTTADIALKRLRHLCETDPHFALLKQTAEALSRIGAFASREPKPDYRTIVATVWDAPSYAAITTIECDEAIGEAFLIARRRDQAKRLIDLVITAAISPSIKLPDESLPLAAELIDEWQPTAREPELSVRLTYEIQKDVRQHFATAQLRLAIAVQSKSRLSPEDAEHACITLRLIDPTTLIPRELRVRSLMIEDMGITAVRMANTGQEADHVAALRMFEAIHRQGAIHAGVHVARMRLDGWGTAGKGRDVGKANREIDAVFAEFTGRKSHPFETRTGLEEMLSLRIAVKATLIVEGKKKPQVVHDRTVELVKTMLLGMANGIESYGVMLAALIAPDNPNPDELRMTVDSHPEAKDYCARLHEQISAQCREAGMEIPVRP